MNIVLLSDTHGYLDNSILQHINQADEVWHAGDFGAGVAHTLTLIKPLRGVFGNIDDNEIRKEYGRYQSFNCNGLQVLMIHIGGYPPAYQKGIIQLIKEHKPQLFISGHSHILKIIRDTNNHLLHINPGAAGKHGFHLMRTMVKFEITNAQIKNLCVIELGARNATL
ncbi:MAG: metallophosphoesterase family protein [Bacteroidia bacterium]|nr:metallophosphoesterase family protein [Bacteroidia bacterium]